MLNRGAVALSLCLSFLAASPVFSQDQNVVNPLRGNVVAISRTVALNNVITAVSLTLAHADRVTPGQPPRRLTGTRDPAFHYLLFYNPGLALSGCFTRTAT